MRGEDQAASRRELAAIFTLVLLALGLRLVDLGRLPLWEDEAATWWFATTLDGSLAEHAKVEPTPPLHYILVGWVYEHLGRTDAWIRLPSAIFGALSVGAAYLFGRRLVSPTAGAWAALWLALHPWHVFFSREARVYPLLLLLTLLLAWAVWIALEKDRRRDWIAVSALSALALWSHFYGLFLGFTLGVAVLAFARSRRARLRGLAALALAGLSFVPYLATAIPHLRAGGSVWSVERIQEQMPEMLHPARVAEGHALGARRSMLARGLYQPPTPDLIWLPAIVTQGVLVLLGLAVLLRTSAEDARRRGSYLLLLWLLPVLVPWLVSQLSRPVFHPGRHDFYVLGSSAIAVGTGLAVLGHLIAKRGWRRLAGRVAAISAVVVLMLAAAFRLAWLHVQPVDPRPRLVGAWLAQHADPTTPIVATGIRRALTERYLVLAGGDASIESFPASTDRHPGWSDPFALLERPEELAAEAEARARQLGLEGTSRIWVLPRPYPEDPATRRRMTTWLVDRHLFEGLAAAGFQAVSLDLPADLEGQIQAFEQAGDRSAGEPP